jgi:hypothetical protein
MLTLHVEKVPKELYEALRAYARVRGNSISAEVIRLLMENIPTRDELAKRRRLLKTATKLSHRRPSITRRFPAAEDMQREDRVR